MIVLTVHEFSHAWAGHMLGDITAKREGRLTLNPLSHIDPFMTLLLPLGLILLGSPVVFGAAKPVPFNPERVRYGEFGAAMIAVAGPLSNLVMAALAAGIVNLFQGSLGVDLIQILLLFVIINIGLFVFNMIPIPPLDGSRLLYAFAPESLQRFMATLENFGVFLIFGLIVMAPQAFNFISNINNTIFKFLIN